MRDSHAGGLGGPGGLLFGRRALQVYAFVFVNTLIFVMRSQWIVSMPSTPDTNVLSRHDATVKRDGEHHDPRLQTSLRKERRPLHEEQGYKPQGQRLQEQEVEFGADGQPVRRGGGGGGEDSFLPKKPDVIDAIWARGRARIQAELKRWHNNISAIEPFNPWGPVYIWDWFSPDYNCPTMERLGRVGDGGKWVCGVDVLRARKCLAYSYGVNRDLSFELEMIGRTGCEVHAFDPTVGGVPPDCTGNPHITFHKQALGPASGPTDVFLLVENLLDTMRRHNHTFIDVLKVDIEGSEWDTFRALLPEKALPFGQLLIELHFRDVAEVFAFFENMDAHGFRIFMRETNHNPCAAGKLPIAVEFSLINPEAYFQGEPPPAAVHSIAARPEPAAYKGVIYVLSHKGNMERLTKMLVHLEKNFNRFYRYPVLVFHEGDFGPEEQQRLREAVPRMALGFRAIAFAVPAWLDKGRIPERTPCSYHSSTVGYRHMNRFLAYFASAALADEGFEWQWRLDDDSLLTEEVGYDVFRLMAENGKRYGFTNIVQDDAKCVLGLWDAARDYIDRQGLEPQFFTRWTEGAVFYNNFEVSHSSIWTSPEYKAFFEHLDRLGGIYYHRWGDAPIRSIGVSLFVNETEVHHFTDVAYTHLPFIQRNASGLPSPAHTLLSRAGGAFSANCSSSSPEHGHGHAPVNGTCFSGRPSGIVYTVLNDEPGQLEKLLATLASLDAHFNDAHRYPVAVFGADLGYARRARIRNATRAVVEFHDLSFLEAQPLPAWVDRTRVPAYVDCAFGDDSVLDRKRNRYMALEGLPKLARQFDFLLRLVPGALLTENVTADPFQTMASQGKTYGYLMTVTDDARCIKGLREATLRYARRAGMEPTFLHVLPPDAVFYDGFEVTHASLWLGEEYRAFVGFLDREGGMFYHRWTERNVLTEALGLFAPPQQLHRFLDVGFEHAPFVKQTSNRAVLKKPVESTWRDRSVNVAPAPDLSALLAARRFGFLGADVATSVRLPSTAGYGAYAWLLGDTYLGTSDGVKRGAAAHTVNNALAFMPLPADGEALGPADVTFFWREDSGGVPAAAFQLEGGRDGARASSDAVLWPVSGLAVEYEGTAKLLLFAQRVAKKHDLTELLVGDGLNFEVEGTSLICVDNPAAPPSRWKYRVVEVPGTDAKHNWYSAVALADGREVATSPDDMVYIVGNVGTRGMGVFDEESKNVLGRIKVSDLLLEHFGRLEMLDDAGTWARGVDPARRRAVLTPAVSETSLQYNPELNTWTALAVDGVSAQLVLWTAPKLEGPWAGTVVHSIAAPYDDLSRYRCYAGKAHPQLASARPPGQGVELVFSYVCNAPSDGHYLFEEGQLSLYAPQFVRMVLGPPVDGRSS